jgi:hypothetical protein
LAKEKKQAELTQKLNFSKKSLALALGNSSIAKGAVGDIDARIFQPKYGACRKKEECN